MSFHFSFDLKSQKKKKHLVKKNNFIQSILLQKVKKMIFSGEKKKTVPLAKVILNPIFLIKLLLSVVHASSLKFWA